MKFTTNSQTFKMNICVAGWEKQRQDSTANMTAKSVNLSRLRKAKLLTTVRKETYKASDIGDIHTHCHVAIM